MSITLRLIENKTFILRKYARKQNKSKRSHFRNYKEKGGEHFKHKYLANNVQN